jgi:prephenate dehydrogenase
MDGALVHQAVTDPPPATPTGPPQARPLGALISHVPHLVAGARPAVPRDPPRRNDRARAAMVTEIARHGGGLRRRYSRPAAAVREGVQAVAAHLGAAADVLAAVASGDDDAVKQLTALLEAGREGAAKIPGKQGGPAPDYVVVQVVIGDRPGELARLFAAAGLAGINIEDVRIEHSPGLPVGVAELSVRPDAAAPLSAALSASGWPVASPA